ncbi:MAG: 50S ribosomal protein L23, partial [bacterium]
SPSANKSEIKKAIERLFKVKVLKVNTVTLPGKTHRFGAKESQDSNRKKAIATLKAGDKIALFEGA